MKRDYNTKKGKKRWTKLWQHEGEEYAIALLGIENQTEPEKYMPFRVFGYEGNSYNSQMARYGKILYPVVTIVLYFGKRKWNYSRSALENIHVPDVLKPYVNDVKINLIDIHRMKDNDVQKFHGDFRMALNLILDNEYVPEEEDVIHHADAFLTFMEALTKNGKFEDVRKALNAGERKEGVKMTTVIDLVYAKGEAKGEGKLAKLINLLLSENNVTDALKVTQDEKARQEMYKKYGLID